MRRVLLLAAGILLVTAGAARADCATGASENHQGQAAVTVAGGGAELGLNWKPCDITVSGGTKVTFSFAADAHTSESEPGQAERWNFTRPGGHTFRFSGTYRYFCAFHRDVGMVGRVTVVGGESPPVNRAPTARFTITPKPAFAGERVTLDASSSSDPDGNALTYHWNIGGRSVVGSKPTLTRVFDTAGSRTVRLQVVDDRGARSGIALHVLRTRSFHGSALAGKTATVSSSGRLRVKVRCPKTSASACSGRVSLTRGGKRIALGSFTKIRAGKTMRVALRLTKTARRALARHHRLSATVHLATRKPARRSLTSKLKLVRG